MKLQPASFWRRLVAIWLDGIFMGAISFAIAYAFHRLLTLPQIYFSSVLYPALSLAVFMGVIVWPIYRWGQSPGKKAMGLRIYFTGGSGSFSEVLGREIGAKFLSMISVVGVLIAAGSSKLALHDRIMKTQVLEEVD
jgi:uncharacterized RDD family membrane protein YckC